MSIQTAPGTPMMTAALNYAARGWRVLPLHTMRMGRCSCNRAGCPSPAKHPRTLTGSTGASSDLAQVRKWWGMWPDANVGVATGGDLVVVDLDVSRNGVENWEALADENGGPLDTLTVRTGGGGKHLYLRAPHKVQNSVDKLAMGVDVRGEGGYVVAPPSVHASSKAYEWLDADPLEDASHRTADAPTWLLAKLANMRVIVSPSSATPDAITKGGRNSEMFRAARRLRAQGLAYEELVAAVLEMNERRCSPPLDPAEVKQIARSASGYAAGTPPEVIAAHIVARADAPPPEDPGDMLAPPPEDTDEGWARSLRRKKSGALEATFGNACLILRNGDGYAGTLAYDEMALRPMWSGKPLTDGLMGVLRERLEREHGLVLGLDTLTHSVLTVASERSAHPVRAYLEGLTWDGAERLTSLARRALHVEDTLSAQLVRKWMLAAVRRAFEPGVKVDTVLVLIGEQGARKSTFFRELATPAWFGDSPIDPTNKDAVLQMRAAWIYELAEIDGLTSRRHAADIKAFATSAIDTIRVPYGRGVEPIPRSSVMCGTTNKDAFLTDDTGARRYWLVRVPDLRQVEHTLIVEERDQLWAEAVAAVREGEDHWLDPSQELDLRARAREHIESDPWEEVVEKWLLAHPEPATAAEILMGALSLESGRMQPFDKTRIGRVMHGLGYCAVRPPRQPGRDRTRVYVREETQRPTDPRGPGGPPGGVGVVDQNGVEKSTVVQVVQVVHQDSYAGARASVAGASCAGETPAPLPASWLSHEKSVGPVGPVGPPSVLSGEIGPPDIRTVLDHLDQPAAPKPVAPWSKPGAA